MSHFIDIVHTCVTPEILPEYGDGTVWECDCGKKWGVWTQRNFGDVLPQRAFYVVSPTKWNDAENRLKTESELDIEREEWRKRNLENQTKSIKKEKSKLWKLRFFNN